MKEPEDRENLYLKKYVIVVIDPITGNETDFEYEVNMGDFQDKRYLVPVSESCGIPVMSAMRRLKIRSDCKK